MQTTHRVRTAAAAVGASLLLGACASVGMGGGDLTMKGKPEQPVLFAWKSDNGGISGTMTATLPGATYQGRFFQITQQTQRESLAPLWDGWTEGWSDWSYWGYGDNGPYGVTQFITRYTGKVVASLKTADGKKMRCRLHLVTPVRGMAGGGEGECQIAGAGTIHATF